MMVEVTGGRLWKEPNRSDGWVTAVGQMEGRQAHW